MDGACQHDSIWNWNLMKLCNSNSVEIALQYMHACTAEAELIPCLTQIYTLTSRGTANPRLIDRAANSRLIELPTQEYSNYLSIDNLTFNMN